MWPFGGQYRGLNKQTELIRAVQPAGRRWPTNMRKGRSPEESAKECYSERYGKRCEYYCDCHRFQESEEDAHQSYGRT